MTQTTGNIYKAIREIWTLTRQFWWYWDFVFHMLLGWWWYYGSGCTKNSFLQRFYATSNIVSETFPLNNLLLEWTASWCSWNKIDELSDGYIGIHYIILFYICLKISRIRNFFLNWKDNPPPGKRYLVPRTLKNEIYKKLLILIRKRPKVNLKMGKKIYK